MQVDQRAQREGPTASEEALVDKLIPVIEALVAKTFLSGTTYRDTHAKSHAAVRATFAVEPGLPPELAVGLFATPRTYPAWLRFSNLNAVPRADKKRDLRAVAIKLMEVPGEMLWQSEPDARTLDLITMSSQTFLAPNLEVFYQLEVANLRGGLAAVRFFLTHPRILLTIARAFSTTANLLEIPYWSQTPYALGDRAVQYHLRPHQQATSRLPDDAPPNFLRQRLQEDLARREARFDFMVQLQTDPKRMPIDDPMVAWDPRLSPYRKVATLTLPVQRCDSPAQLQFCENLSFNPWRTLPAHRPLGDINYARLRVYPAIARFRHRRNQVRMREPRPHDPTFDATGLDPVSSDANREVTH